MYRIKTGQRDAARRLGVVIRPSTVKNKKLDVFKGGKKVASVGAMGYKDFHLYTKEKGKDFAEKRRRLYKIRHQKNRGKVGTPSYYADKLLWD